MARTLDQITQAMDDRKALEPALASLNSVSQTARWRLWRNVVAYALWLHEQIFDTLRADMQAIADAATPGQAPWYAARVLAYQHTDVLTIIDGLPAYAVVDASLQIVKRVSIEDTGTPGQILVKVAKGSATAPVPLTNGIPDPLNNELAGLADYLSEVKFAGTDVQLRSVTPDVVTPTLVVYFEPQRTEAVVKTETEAAIKAYLANLDFNGRYRQSSLVDAVQAVTGVVDVTVTGVLITDAVPSSHSDPRTQLFYAGYAIAGNLNASITYTPAP